MGVAADLCGHAGRLSVVILAQFQMVFISEPDQVLAASLQQAAVGGMRYRFGHHGSVHNDFVQAAFLDQARCAGRFDGDDEQELNAFFTNAFPPAAQTGRINGQLRLQVGLTAKVLPVGILQPGRYHRFIGGIVGMLQIQPSQRPDEDSMRGVPGLKRSACQNCVRSASSSSARRA